MKKQVLEFVNLEKDSLRIYKLCDNYTKQIESFRIKKGLEEDNDDAITI